KQVTGRSEKFVIERHPRPRRETPNGFTDVRALGKFQSIAVPRALTEKFNEIPWIPCTPRHPFVLVDPLRLASPLEMTLQRSPLEIETFLVGNPSMKIDVTSIALGNEDFPDVYGLFADIEAICYGQRFRIYWRLSDEEYIPVYNSIGLKAALNTIYKPRIYVVVDEVYFWSQISKSFLLDVLERHNFASIPDLYKTSPINIFSDLKVLKVGSACSANVSHRDMGTENTQLRDTARVSIRLTFKCALTEKRPTDDPAARFDHLLSKTSPRYTNETKRVDEQLKLLMKGFPEKKTIPVTEQFPKSKNTKSPPTVKGSKKKPVAN
ncbi:hypothetical protein V1478_014593, partial [Vespula squamosa]